MKVFVAGARGGGSQAAPHPRRIPTKCDAPQGVAGSSPLLSVFLNSAPAQTYGGFLMRQAAIHQTDFRTRAANLAMMTRIVLAFIGQATSRESLRDQSRRQRWRMVNPLYGHFEVGRLGAINIDERLWVAVHEREPGALHLHHDFVAAEESVIDVGQLEPNGGRFTSC
jgi:hypothetical protein